MSYLDSKYYPDKFFIKFDTEQPENLLYIDENGQFIIELAIFIHEYYHYLTNISTFQGIREFNACFQDKVRIVTKMQSLAGLDGFPLFSNRRKKCRHLIAYWKDIDDITVGDSTLDKLALEISNSPSGEVNIEKIKIISIPMTVQFGSKKKIKGRRMMVRLNVDGIPSPNFLLPIAAIDEFLSSSIDEYLYLTSATDNSDLLNDRVFFPYRLFDKILAYYGIYLLDPKLKIIIAYKALHGPNPTVSLIRIIKKIAEDQDSFVKDPMGFLEKYFHWDEKRILTGSLDYLDKFIRECFNHGRINLANACNLILESGRLALSNLQDDPYYFVRPFVDNDLNTIAGREQFLEQFRKILNQFHSFIQLKGRELVGAFTDPEKNHLALLLAVSEVLDGAEKSRFIERIPRKYDLDGDPGYDKIENFPGGPPLTLIWHNALNDTSFYKLYLDYRKQQKLAP